VLDFWWQKWHWDRFFSGLFRFSPIIIIPPALHTHLIFSLLLPEGQTGKALEPSKSNAFLEIGGHWIEKYFRFFIV
jgi:hypothetical protein